MTSGTTRRHSRGTKRYFFGPNEVSKKQAKEIRSIGGKIVTVRDDEYIWRNW